MQKTFLKKKSHGYDMIKYVGEITYDIDNFLCDNYKFTSTYIMKFDNNTFVFRLPGATRGNIKIDNNNIIQSINFYDDRCFGKAATNACYKKEVVDYMISKYIGCKIIYRD